jgi:hypothetical protein
MAEELRERAQVMGLDVVLHSPQSVKACVTHLQGLETSCDRHNAKRKEAKEAKQGKAKRGEGERGG